jgi:hypothetical protein
VGEDDGSGDEGRAAGANSEAVGDRLGLSLNVWVG